MIVRRVLILALVVSPLVASAQRRGTRSNFDEMIAASPIGLKLSNRDVEEMNPVRLLVDKRKDLQLTDDQLKALKEMDGKVREQNKPHLKVLDSLRSAMRPRAGADAEMERVRAMVTREEVVGVVRVIRGNYAAALNEALALLDATQAPKADELLKKQAAKAEETLNENMGGGRSGMGGGRRGRPPA